MKGSGLMNWKKKLLALGLSLALTLSLAACGQKAEKPAQMEEPAQSEEPAEVPETPEFTPAEFRIAALKGPTAMGLVELMSLSDTANEMMEGKENVVSTGNTYEFTLAGSADEVTPALIKGDLDMACVPANLAAVLYGKTEGAVEVLAVNTLGVLYIVENGETVQSMADLKGQTIVAAGKGSTPSMRAAMDETERRRKIQDAYNKAHGIVPKTIIKDVREILEISKSEDSSRKAKGKPKKLTDAERAAEIAKLEQEMKEASKLLEFEYAAVLRDRIIELRGGK